MHLLDKLNPQQREAADTVEGPLLILAGAGSGKTRVITYRIAHLIQNVGVHADSVIAVTFTNKAAGEMGERVSQLVRGHSVAQPTISTFHSFCVRVLRRDIDALRIGDVGHRRDFAIYDESDQSALIKSAMKRLGIDDKQLTPRGVLSRISWAKNHMLDPQQVYLQSADPKTERIAQIYEVYRKELLKANALDFDDLLLETVRLLKSSAEVREKYTRRYQYLMIDEYQDTNRPQYELMKLLSGERQNVCVVGDEDQSIYSWRGADIKNILEFEKDFPKAKVIRLEQNYRSTQTILEAASAVVANNKMRKGKNLWTSRLGGGKIGYYEAADGDNEALFVADHASKFLKQAAQSNLDTEHQPRLAVLYRTNSQSRLFEEALRRYGLKYNVVGGFSFYERAEIKDMIGYLKFINNPDDTIALLRVINTPARGIGKTTVETLERIALETGISLWAAMARTIREQLLPPRALAALKNFKQIIDDSRAMLFGTFSDKLKDDVSGPGTIVEAPTVTDLIADAVDSDTSFDFGEYEDHSEGPNDDAVDEAVSFNPSESTNQATLAPSHIDNNGEPVSDGFRPSGGAATLPEVLKFLIDRTGYIKLLEQEGTPEAIARIENLQELVNAARDSRDRGETLEEFLDHAALVSDVDQYEASAGITLMTLHAAKGLEFSLVFLVGMEEGLFPHSRTFIDVEGLEEERRLCYVGMTRAMDSLVISRARYRRRYASDMPENSVPSRFLEEIPSPLLEDIGQPRSSSVTARPYPAADSHFNYEDEDQSANHHAGAGDRKPKKTYSYPTYNSVDNIADFFSSRGKKFTVSKTQPVAQPAKGRSGFRPGQRVKHPKYGEGTVYQREGEGESAKITVQFPRFGLKKLVEKYAQLEKA